MKDRPIGVFDSGLGGLTCVKQILEMLPNENIVFLGDTKRNPYGVNTTETLTRYTTDDVAFLQRRDVKLIVAACGTVSSNVPARRIQGLSVPFVDVITPTIDAALKATKTGRIGIIGHHQIRKLRQQAQEQGQERTDRFKRLPAAGGSGGERKHRGRQLHDQSGDG